MSKKTSCELGRIRVLWVWFLVILEVEVVSGLALEKLALLMGFQQSPTFHLALKYWTLDYENGVGIFLYCLSR